MPTRMPSRFFIVLQDPELWPAYDSESPELIESALQSRLSLSGFRVVDRPTRDVDYPADDRLTRLRKDPNQPMVIVLSFDDEESLRRFARAYRPQALILSVDPRREFQVVVPNSGLAVDLPISAADVPGQHWCPAQAWPSLFGNRAHAKQLIRAEAFPGWDGKGKEAAVNVLMVDQGLQAVRFPGRPALGWPVKGRMPFTGTGRHGSMVARNALSLADTGLYDCPLLPDRIGDLPCFLSRAMAAYIAIILSILLWRLLGSSPSWVVVNAWGMYDRSLDAPAGSSLNYSENPNHLFNVIVAVANLIGLDVVFAAGNCGEFCPSSRCGRGDRGPGNSILGANSMPDVLTVGAVRTDTTWLGYSSQGPGQARMTLAKPDLCTPSHFGELGDASLDGINTGTSAASGMAAAVVSALRTRWPWDSVSPDKMRDLLRAEAWIPVSYTDAHLRFGRGIIDLAAAVTAAEKSFV